MKSRPRYTDIWKALSSDKSMVFMAGPRQTGKTTLAKMFLEQRPNGLYFNWDIPRDRARLIENPDFFSEMERRDLSAPLVVFDEIHKYKDWKNYLKGAYDRFHEGFEFLVTGSGRLDMYQKGGDSLAGRYFLFHLWPFTLSELGDKTRTIEDFMNAPLALAEGDNGALGEIWEGLETFSGFPEPFLKQSNATYNRWSSMYAQQLIREDIRDLTAIKSISDLETLYYLMASRVCSPLSIPSLSKDLKSAYNTVANWIAVFERFFISFSIGPWTRKISRAIQKERKSYLWDTPRIKDDAARFENMVAIELFRAVTTWNDMGWGRFSLHFIKNKEQQEVDFLIAADHDPFLLVEAKLTETRPSAALRKFQDCLQIPAVQLVRRPGGFRLYANNECDILVAPAWQWIAALPW